MPRKDTPKLRDGVMKRGATWSYVIRVKDIETGISKPRWVGGYATEQEAKAARDEARVKARRGEYIDRNRITVTAYLNDWIGSHAMEIKPRTLHDYRSCIRLYVTPRIGKLPIQAVRPSTITKLYRDLLISGGRDGKPLAIATVTHLHAVLRKAFRDAVIAGERIDGATKSGRTRVVSIDDETVAVLRQHKADQAADQLKAGDSWRGVKDSYVFTTGWSEPLYPDTVTSLMTKLVQAHNQPGQGPHPKDQLPHARLHDLRHIHATTLLLSGVPVHVVAARLGHADPAITLRVYAHVIRTAEAAAADIFAQAVKAA